MRVAESKPSMDDALAHYGVKGMKWGVRKRASETTARFKTDKEFRKKVVTTVAVATLAAGASAASYSLGKSRGLNIGEVKRRNDIDGLERVLNYRVMDIASSTKMDAVQAGMASYVVSDSFRRLNLNMMDLPQYRRD